MLLLAISTTLALIYAVLKPLGDGLFDTSMWVAKILAPKDVGDNAKQFLKITQASLMDGWLSNIPFFQSIALISSIIVAGFYHWWLAPIVFVVVVTLGVFTRALWTKSACYYILCMHHKMVNRAADYKRDNDTMRFTAAEETLRDLEKIVAVYTGSRLKPPTEKQLKDIPYGDMQCWLKRWESVRPPPPARPLGDVPRL